MWIESPQNVRVRKWAQLKVKKNRLLEGLFLVEGVRLVEELLQSDWSIHAVLWDVSTDELPNQIRQHPKCAAHFFELSPGAFASVSDTVTSQGVIAIAKLPHWTDHSLELAAQSVLFDGIQDPGNLGTLLRSCDAFGFPDVFCGSGTVDPFAPKVVRASMGGLFRLRTRVGDSLEWITTWRAQFPDGQVIHTAAHAASTCDSANLTGPCLFVIGSEAFGVRSEIQSLCTMEVAIPMQGSAESLNAGVAGSVLLYESMRQRRLV